MIHELKGTWETRPIETNDDFKHMIEHIGDVTFNNHNNKGYVKDVLHVPKSQRV